MKKQILFILMMLMPMMANADDSGSCGDNVTYTYKEATQTLTISGTDDMNNYKSYKNTPWYSYRKQILNVIIESGVRSIGDLAFSSCSSLTSVTIPNSVTSIGYGSFGSCTSLPSITIPNSVTSIAAAAFSGCSSLTLVTIPNSVTFIGDDSFARCTGLTSITIPNSVTSIGNRTFENCERLTLVTIGTSVTSIGYHAFYNCNISEVISKIEEPFNIIGKSDTDLQTFSINTFNNATLYVPVGTIDKYKSTEGWKDFKFIEEKSVDKYKLTYIVDSEEYKTYEIAEGETIPSEPAPTKEGYTFSGWSEIPETMPAHDVTVTGTFTVNKYTITYMIDNEVYQTESVDYGSTITPPSAPEREGYTFEWRNVPETMPAKDITIEGSYTLGIDAINADDEDVKWYSIDGKQIKTPRKGMNIVKTSNGKTRKVLMK